MGSLILFKIQGKKDSYEIVDGQQRITTLFILLIAIRNLLDDFIEQGVVAKNKDGIEIQFKMIRDKIVNKIAFFDSSIGVFKGSRLIPSDSIRFVFEEMCKVGWRGTFTPKVGKKSVKRQNGSLKPIYDYFSSKLKQIDPKHIHHLIETVNEIRAITVDIDDLQEAFLLFERTNARGRDLEVSDLLKNHLFMNLIDDIGQTEDRWKNITDNAGNSMIRMLKYFYVSQKGYIKNSELYKSLKNFSDGNAEELLTEIEKFSIFYKVMNEAKEHYEIVNYLDDTYDVQQSHNEDRAYYIFKAIEGLRLFGITQVYPLIYSFLNSFFSNNLNNDEKHKKSITLFFETIEKYHFINNFICDRIGNEVEKLYATYSSNFSQSKTPEAFQRTLNELYKELGKRLANQSEFVERFTDLNYSRQTKDLMYIFDRFNNVDSKGAKLQTSTWLKIYDQSAKYSRSSKDIEHWYPQNSKETDPEEDSVIHNIGNLSVFASSTNGKLGNKTPKEKYNFLKENPELDKYPFNQKFLTDYGPFDSWGEAEINKRAEDMAKFAYTVVWHFIPPIQPDK